MHIDNYHTRLTLMFKIMFADELAFTMNPLVPASQDTHHGI